MMWMWWLACTPEPVGLPDGEEPVVLWQLPLPEGMPEPNFYRPVERGLEIRIADKLRELKKRNHQSD